VQDKWAVEVELKRERTMRERMRVEAEEKCEELKHTELEVADLHKVSVSISPSLSIHPCLPLCPSIHPSPSLLLSFSFSPSLLLSSLFLHIKNNQHKHNTSPTMSLSPALSIISETDQYYYYYY